MTETGQFIPGMKLSEMFFREEVEPQIKLVNPELKYSAGLLGPGSEVMGFDNAMSSDHHWGPRVMLFLSPQDVEQMAGSLKSMLRHKLPHRFKGFPTSFTSAGVDPQNQGVQLLDYENQGPVNHRVEILSFRAYLKSYIDIDITKRMRACDWLSIPQQKLRSLKDGRLFRDNYNLQETLKKLEFYPHDLWLYLLASTWKRIEQEEHLMGRAGYVGDEIGSALIAAKIVRDLMRLSFLMERTYFPYSKWFGTAFQKLAIASELKGHLENTLAATHWKEREENLCRAYRVVAEWHNRLQITRLLPVVPKQFHDRPFKVISMGEFSRVIKEAIQDHEVKELIHTKLFGNLDLVSDSTDISESSFATGVFKELYL